MGMEQEKHGGWNKIRKLTDMLDTPYADQIYIAKNYTKADLRRDLLATIPKDWSENA